MSSPWSAPGQPPEPAAGAAPQPLPAAAAAPGAGLERELVPRVPLFPLRPLGLGEMLGAAVRIYRVRPRLVLGLTALVYGIAFVLTSAVQGAGMIPTITELQVLADDPLATTDIGTSPAEIYSIVLSSVGTGLITLVAAQVTTLVLARLTIQEALGRGDDPDLARTILRRRGLAAVGMGLLSGLLAMIPMIVAPLVLGIPLLIVREAHWWTILPLVLGVLLGLLGSLYVTFRLVLAVPVLAVEEVGVVAALRRSAALSRGRRAWRVLGCGLLLYLVYTVAQQAVSSVFGVIGMVAYFGILLATNFGAIVLAMSLLLIVTMFGTYLAVILTAPFLSAGITTLYADARMRHEAWDVELQAAARGERQVVPA